MIPKRQMRSRQRLIAVPPLPLCCVLVLSLSWPSISSAWLPSPILTSSRHPTLQHQQQSVKVSLGLGVKKIEDDAAYDQSPDTTDASSSEEEAHHHRNMTRNVLKKVRVAKAQAEIDRILQGPDAPIDTEAEMEKVISLHHSPSEQPLLDAQMAQLESELYNAVKQQDFSMASHKQAELTQLQQDGTTAEAAAAAAAQPLEPPPNGAASTAAASESDQGHHHSSHLVDDGGAILQVNAAFYRAFSKKSLEDMERVWLRHDGDTSVCIHPSHKPLVGARRIAKSWKQMFASSDNSFQRNWMEPHKIRIQIKGAHMAIVTCEEHVFGRRFVRGRKRQTELINKLLATNIFRKVAGKWYMCYHHASWHPDSDAAKRALTGGSSGSSTMVSSSSSNNYHDHQDGWDDDDGNNSNYPSSWKQRRRRRQREDDEDTVIGMDGILGNDFGPILGDGSDNNNNSNGGEDGKPTKRIIMGASLSDILNGSLGDILGNDGGKSGGSSSSNNDNSDLPQEGAIIRFARMGDDQDDDDDDDDEIEIDEDELDLSEMDEIEVEEDDDDDDDEGESVAIIKEWAKSSAKRQSKSNNKNEAADGNDVESNVNGEGQRNGGKVFLSKEPSLRQRCIQALRKLCDQGSISPRQKRVLLTDIITCSSRGEDSMVEVAYDLLCGSSGIEQPHDSNEKDDEADDTAEKEFADQCRVFAQEHLQREETELLER